MQEPCGRHTWNSHCLLHALFAFMDLHGDALLSDALLSDLLFVVFIFLFIRRRAPIWLGARCLRENVAKIGCTPGFDCFIVSLGHAQDLMNLCLFSRSSLKFVEEFRNHEKICSHADVFVPLMSLLSFLRRPEYT